MFTVFFRVLRLVLSCDLSTIKPISDAEFWQEIPPAGQPGAAPGQLTSPAQGKYSSIEEDKDRRKGKLGGKNLFNSLPR